jgi:asparagine synthase (glutamine-hydrolysing)
VSAIVGLCHLGGQPLAEPVARDMLGAMAGRGADSVALWRGEGVILAVSRFDWECRPEIAGPAEVALDGSCAAVADASIYYREDLRKRLAAEGVTPAGAGTAHLVLAAYRAWGEECAARIEGDFAFILWDGSRRRMLCGRDASGVRPLHYADLPEGFLAASTVGALARHPRTSTELDLPAIALDAAGIIFAATDATCYQGVRIAPAGATVVRAAGHRPRVIRWWDPGVGLATGAPPADEAAEELRQILAEAVTQRLCGEDPTGIWLSGGWDSAAVFVAAQHRLAGTGALRPVSVSYPPGDSGREDDRIEALAGRWQAPVSWVDGSATPLMSLAGSRADLADGPYPFMFDAWMRQVAAATRALPARVAVTGHGGNFLFESSPSFLSDLLGSGRVLRMYREWSAMGVQHRRAVHLFKWAVQPLLPELVRSLIVRARGKPLLGTYERPLPRWLRPDFVAEHGLAERARRATPPVEGGARSELELAWFMTHPAFARLNGLSFASTLGEGVETRAPLLDPRVIRFAVRRPWWERYSSGGAKWLLRRMMSGHVPDELLAPRAAGGGTLASYFDRSLAALLPALYRLFESPVMAELGMVDPAALRADLDRYAAGRRHQYLPEQLMSLAHAETWLRSRLAGRSDDDATARVPISAVAV